MLERPHPVPQCRHAALLAQAQGSGTPKRISGHGKRIQPGHHAAAWSQIVPSLVHRMQHRIVNGDRIQYGIVSRPGPDPASAARLRHPGSIGAKPRSHPAADRRGRRRLTLLCHPVAAACLPCPGHRHRHRLRAATAWADREHAHEEHLPAVQVGSPAKAAWVQARLTSDPSQAGRFCRWMQVVESCVNRFGRRKDGPLKRA